MSVQLGTAPKGANLRLIDDTLKTGGSSNLPTCSVLGDELLVGRHLWLDASGNYETPNFVAHATIFTTTVTGYRRKGMLIDGHQPALSG